MATEMRQIRDPASQSLRIITLEWRRFRRFAAADRF